MSDEFQPGIANLVATTGERVHRASYDGTRKQQHKQSIELMVQKIQEGYKDRAMRELVGQVLHSQGLDGRKGATYRQVVTALCDYLRGATVYVPDPVKTEMIQGAAATLCLRPGLCMKAGDCDDQVVALCSLILAAGIPCWIVIEDFGHNPITGMALQGHVLVGCKDEDGNGFAADPSTMKPVGGFSPGAVSRQWVDPLKDAPTEIIGFGRAGRDGFGQDVPAGSTDVTTVSDTTSSTASTGSIPSSASNGVQIPGTWTSMTGNNVTAGLRYAVGIVAPAGWTATDVQSYFSPPGTVTGATKATTQTAGPQFLVEQVIPGSSTTGASQTGWIFIGVARTAGVVPTDSSVNVAAVLQQDVVPQTTAPSQNTALTTAPVATSSMGLGTALAYGAGAAVVGGVVWHLYKKGFFK